MADAQQRKGRGRRRIVPSHAIGTAIGLSLYPVLAWTLLEALLTQGF